MLLRRYYPLMTQRSNGNPMELLNNMEQFQKQLYRMFDADTEQSAGSFPIELSETTEAYQLKALVPDVSPEQINIQADNETLTLSVNWEPATESCNATVCENSEQESEKNGEQGSKPIVHIREFRYGQMERTLQFAQPIMNEAIEANYRNGVLTLTIPKETASKKRSIKINVA